MDISIEKLKELKLNIFSMENDINAVKQEINNKFSDDNVDIKKDKVEEKFNDYVNDYINSYLIKNSELIKDNELFQIEYDVEALKKDIYKLSSERDIKDMQIKSDKNELDYKFSQNKITSTEYKKLLKELNDKSINQNLLYDDLIFNIIDKTNIDDIKNKISSYNLNSIDLSRLANAINAVCENKINEFRENNKNFMIDKLSYWNYKYNEISKGISKAREIENYILSLANKRGD